MTLKFCLGRTEHHVAICGRDSGIVTLAIRDPARPSPWPTMPDLIALYHDLAGAGALSSHRVMAGGRAMLCIAVSAEDVQHGDMEPGLPPAGRPASVLLSVRTRSARSG